MNGTILVVQRKSSLIRTVSLCMALLLAAAPVALCADSTAPALAPTTPPISGIRTIALFQSANDAGASGEVARAAVDSAIKWRINAGGAYQATTFTTRLPAIQRAMTFDTTEGALTNSQVQEPVTSVSSAQAIAKVMGADGFMLLDIATYSQDTTTHAINLTVSGNLYATATGDTVRTFAVTGTASPATADEPDTTVMLRAADSVAEQIASTIGANSPRQVASIPVATGKHGVNGGSILLVVLAAALAGVIAHNVSSHGSAGSSIGGSSTGGTTTGSSTGGPPPPPGI